MRSRALRANRDALIPNTVPEQASQIDHCIFNETSVSAIGIVGYETRWLFDFAFCYT